MAFYAHKIRKNLKSNSSKCWGKHGAVGATSSVAGGGSINWCNHFGKHSDTFGKPLWKIQYFVKASIYPSREQGFPLLRLYFRGTLAQMNKDILAS